MQTNPVIPNLLSAQAEPFLAYLQGWLENLPVLPIAQAFSEPDQAAILSVDVIEGFCKHGALASPRVATIVTPIAALFQQAWQAGVRNIILTQDTHEPDAVEFAQWPAHCVRGSAEAETVSELKALPFFEQVTVFEKNSIASGLNTGLNDWLAAHPAVNTFIVVGDCTDLCTYQLAMHLRLDANARQLQRRVIVPADCVQTYDLPVETAASLGILPHPGDLLHATFLYHMQLNGVEVVKQLFGN
jgi:nicotinamidase-related amidase